MYTCTVAPSAVERESQIDLSRDQRGRMTWSDWPLDLAPKSLGGDSWMLSEMDSTLRIRDRMISKLNRGC